MADTNVLNGYRSVTYNFTLAALTPSQVNNPGSFNPRSPNLVVATTKGKRSPKISASSVSNASTTVQTTPPKTNSQNQQTATIQAQKRNQQTSAQNTADNINGFNQNSPGKYDLFIDDVDMSSIVSFNQGQSLTYEMNFQVFEPYSMNGFFEALQVTALAAGYNDFNAANYAMVMDFMGYPDGAGTPDPVLIPGTTRVFTIIIIGLETTITEKGTIYKVKATALAERAYKSPVATLKRAINVSGKDLKEFFKNLEDTLNKINKETDNTDRYSITVEPAIITSKFYDKTGKVSVAPEMNNIDKGPGAYVGGATQSPAVSKYLHTAHYDAGTPIEDIITSAVRDSEYVGELVKAFVNNGVPPLDSNQRLNYFIVVPSISESGEFNSNNNRPATTYTYTVKPYKMIYNTVIPGTGRQIISSSNLKQIVSREYNYFYTGKNIDILDFKINFNTLYFEEVPRQMGTTPDPDSGRDKPRLGDKVDIKQRPSPGIKTSRSTPVTAPIKETDNASSSNPDGTINASVSDTEPWRQFAKAMHSAVINSKGLILGELVILGDPAFLTASGSGNRVKGDNEIDISNGQILVSVTFNNPIDINPNTGFMDFDRSLVPVSGVYQVLNVRSEFKDGVFKQTLSLKRIPGQSDGSTQTPSSPNEAYIGVKSPYEQSAKSTAPPGYNEVVTTNNGSPGTRANTLDLQNLGLTPSAQNNPGGLGGATLLSSNLRAATSGLSLQNSSNDAASSITESANMIGKAFPNSGAFTLASQATKANYSLTSALDNNALNRSVLAGSAAINQVGAKANTVVGAIPTDLSGVAQAFKINTSQIAGITGLLGSRETKTLPDLYKVVPPNVDLDRAANQGVQVSTLDKTAISNLPALPPVNYNGVGSAFPLGNPVSNTPVSTTPTPSRYQLPPVDYSIQSDSVDSGLKLYNQVSGATPSLESTQLAITSSLGGNSSNLQSSVNSIYGSQSNNNSTGPLLKAVNKTT